MGMVSDVKLYRKHLPQYSTWKQNQDETEAKRLAYLKQNPNEVNQYDIQRGKTLLRAIDVMDEYSQKNAEDMEVATEQVMSVGTEVASFLGMGLGALVGALKPVKNFITKVTPEKVAKFLGGSEFASYGVCGFLGMLVATSIAAFPLQSWAAKAEIGASRKGRFEAMRSDLGDAKSFVVLTQEQEQKLEEKLEATATQKEKKKPFKSIRDSFNVIKEGIYGNSVYDKQKMLFEQRIEDEKALFEEELSPKEIEDAKRDQQLLTKLVQKIDIASQDYAENTELATSTALVTVGGFGALLTMLISKVAPSLTKHTGILSAVAGVGTAILAASVQKEASRVGRFKVKQELSKNPETLVYVDDEKIKDITDFKVEEKKKPNIFKFLIQAVKDKREYDKWKKTEGLKEKNLAKAMQDIEFTDEQLKDAKRLQHNTFKTFNKVDENSQKYSESVEALGQAAQYPFIMLFSMLGAAVGSKYLMEALMSNKNKALGYAKYVGSILLSVTPAILINAFLTKQQKQASRVADMLSIKEMEDYRNFVDYSDKIEIHN